MASTPHESSELLPCIWVGAGVLSYRLCDREFDCEGCDLFHALQGGQPVLEHARGTAGDQNDPSGRARPSGDRTDRYFCRLLAGCALQMGRYYGPGHLWVEPERDGTVLIGLNGHILAVLRPVDEVAPPRVGTWLKRGEACGWIVRGHRSIPFAAPLAGEVVAVNPEVVPAGAPGRAGDGWLMRVRPHESVEAVPDLVRGEDAVVRYLRELRLIKQALRAVDAESYSAAVGAAFEDGGALETDLERVLGAERFEALVAALFPVQIR